MKNTECSPESAIFIQVLDRAMSLLNTLAQYPDPLNLTNLCSHTGLHPSTAHRLLNDLVAMRFIDRHHEGTYRLGMRLLELGNIVRMRMNLREATRNLMYALQAKTFQVVTLATRQGDDIVCIERVFSERLPSPLTQAIDSRAPLHLTDIGKLFLATDTPEELHSYATRAGLIGMSRKDNDKAQFTRLIRELRLIRSQKYAEDSEGLQTGFCSMGVAIEDVQGNIRGGLSIAAPIGNMNKAWLKDLQWTAHQIALTVEFLSPNFKFWRAS